MKPTPKGRYGHGMLANLLLAIVGVACENPELTFVELANVPGDGRDAAAGNDLGEATTPVPTSDGTASSSGLVLPPRLPWDAGDEPGRIDGGGVTTSVKTSTSLADTAGEDTTGEDAEGTASESSHHDTRGASDESDVGASTPSGGSEVRDAAAETASSLDAASSNDSAEPSLICECPEEINPCLSALCLAGLTICTFTPRPGAECDDGDPCTRQDQCDDEGQCGGEPKDCSDQDGVCVEGVCSQDTGECEARPSAQDTPCDDDDLCSMDDVCDGNGECLGTAKDCSVHDSSCTAGTCDAESGECLALPANLGDGCDDDDYCTRDDVCGDDGVSRGDVVDCSEASSDCALGVCDPKNGECKPEPLSGIACDDGDWCTAFDACDDGECKGKEADDCGDAGLLDLTSGSASVTMSNECADDDFDVGSQIPEDSDCDRASGDDVVFVLDLTGFEDPVTLRASTNHETTEFDTVLSLMTSECSDDALVACVDDSDDAGVTSMLEVLVEPGVYTLVVDAYRGNEEGMFHLEVSID